MKKLKLSAQITLVLGIVSFALFVLERLALQDIWHGQETDLSLEWNLVLLSFLPILLFYVSAAITGSILFKELRKAQPGNREVRATPGKI